MALSIDVGLNIAGVRQGIEQLKSLVTNVDMLPLTSNSNFKPMVQSFPLQPTPMTEPIYGPMEKPTNTILQKEQNKSLLSALADLTRALQDNTGSQPSKSLETDKGKKGGFLNEGMLKNIAQIANMGAGLYTAFAQYDTMQTRKRIRQMEADPYGAMIEETTGKGQLANTIASTAGNALGIGASFFIGPLGGMLVSSIVNSISGAMINANTQKEVAAIQERQAKVNQYITRLGTIDQSYMTYGLGSNMWDVQDQLHSKSKGTGLEIDEFMRYANTLSQYGITSVGQAGNLTKAASLANRYTGADTNSLLAYLGTQSRYGQGDAIGNMNYAYSAAVATGLSKNQYGEFLDGLQSVIETGISKGYVKSTKEVSDTMVMFNKLSDSSPFWQGQQGFQRLNQINNGLASATNLSNTSQTLVFRAFQELSGGDAIETFKLMESGLTVDKFKKLAETMNNRYGYSKQEQIAAWKSITGSNYTIGESLYNMSQNLPSLTDTEIERVIANPEIQTEQTVVKDRLNDISVQVSKWGNEYFPEYQKLLAQIVSNTGSDNKVEYDGKDLKLKNNKTIKGKLNGKDVIGRGDMDEFLSAYMESELSVEQRKYLNSKEEFNNHYGDLLSQANNLGSNKAWDDYANATGEQKAKLQAAAIKENEYNHEVLAMLVEQLKILIETEGKRPAVITMPKR